MRPAAALDILHDLERAIGNREIIRVGATRPRPIDVRILAATHRDLEKMCDEGTFRLDLLYRLKKAQGRLPGMADTWTPPAGTACASVTRKVRIDCSGRPEPRTPMRSSDASTCCQS